MSKVLEDSIPSKNFGEDVVFILFIVLILISASGGGIPFMEENSNIPEVPCHKIKGEVIFKELQGENYVLYIELFMDDEIDGYIVKVSEITYDSYEVGDTYEQITCDIGWFNMFKDTIRDMVDAGLLEQF